MPESLLRRANEFTPQEKQAVEVLVGRPLRAGESVSLDVYSCPSIPEEKQREEAGQRLSAFMDRMAERAKDVPEAEIDAAIDEACDYVRHHPK
jgi:hypothetical protein